MTFPCQGPCAYSSRFLLRRRQFFLSHDTPKSLFLAVPSYPSQLGLSFRLSSHRNTILDTESLHLHPLSSSVSSLYERYFPERGMRLEKKKIPLIAFFQKYFFFKLLKPIHQHLPKKGRRAREELTYLFTPPPLSFSWQFTK